VQGGVVATVGVSEFFTAIEQQHFFHEKASAQPLGWVEKRNWNGGRLTIRLARNKPVLRKIHLIKKHESNADYCHSIYGHQNLRSCCDE
jgi:hypothetical protein